jgi:hypothetical protein
MPPERRQDRPMPYPVVEREMRELRARLDVMEMSQRWAVDAGDVSEAESENVLSPNIGSLTLNWGILD